MTLTPEMLALREAAERAMKPYGSMMQIVERDSAWAVAARPAAILALLASYEALTAENNHAIDSIAQLQEGVLALQARLSTVRKLPNLTNPELMQLGARTCSVEGEHFLPMKFGRAVINALHDQIEAASVAAQAGTDAPLFALVNRLSLIDADADFDARELLREYAKEAAGIVERYEDLVRVPAKTQASEQSRFMDSMREKHPSMSLDFMARCDGAPVFNDAGTQARWAGWRDCSTITPTIGLRPRPPECQWCDKTDCRFPACKTDGRS